MIHKIVLSLWLCHIFTHCSCCLILHARWSNVQWGHANVSQTQCQSQSQSQSQRRIQAKNQASMIHAALPQTSYTYYKGCQSQGQANQLKDKLWLVAAMDAKFSAQEKGTGTGDNAVHCQRGGWNLLGSPVRAAQHLLVVLRALDITITIHRLVAWSLDTDPDF